MKINLTPRAGARGGSELSAWIRVLAQPELGETLAQGLGATARYADKCGACAID